MRISLITGLSALALSAVSATAASATDLGAGFSVSGGATVVSDYRFRGISQTDRRIALQGTFTISHASGFYASVWGSSIDDYVAAGGDQEIDLIGGYKHSWGPTTLDVGILYYYYPGSSEFVHGWNSDFAEPYASIAETFGPVTAKATVNYSPKQSALALCQPGCGKKDNVYLAGDLSAGIPKTPISVSAHIGHTFGPSYLSIGKGYTDWNVGATFTHGPLSVGLSYVDTDKNAFNPINGRNLTKGGVVGSVGVSF